MAFQNLCPPALIYLIFSITQVVIDTVKGLYNTALIKVWVAFIFTILLNYLCQLGLGIISWFSSLILFALPIKKIFDIEAVKRRIIKIGVL